MKVRQLKLGIVLAGFTLAAAPAFAQSPKEGGGAPGGGASERSGGGGAATSAGGGGGGGGSVATGSSGGGASSIGGATFSTPSGNAATASNLSFGDRGVREDAPRHRAGFSESRGVSAGDDGQKATPRTASGSSGGGERAVPRGTASSGGNTSNGGDSGARTRTAPRANAGNENNASGTREVPSWSRPRGDRPVTGSAVERVGPPPDRNGGYHGRYYDPYYYGGYYGGYYPYYGYGYNYGYYPYSFGMGYGLYSGLGWSPYYGDPFDPYYSGSGGYSSGVYSTSEQGNLKLKVKPRNAKVYVDGYFVGLVDEFDGAFQKLALNSGRHKVEVRAEGFETAEFDVLITPEQTVTFQGELKRIQ